MYAIYGNMDPINIPPMLAYIPAPWILWVCEIPQFEPFVKTSSNASPGKRRLLALNLPPQAGNSWDMGTR